MAYLSFWFDVAPAVEDFGSLDPQDEIRPTAGPLLEVNHKRLVKYEPPRCILSFARGISNAGDGGQSRARLIQTKANDLFRVRNEILPPALVRQIFSDELGEVANGIQ